MNTSDSSHERLVWLSDGHVSEWVLNALVDNEGALAPAEAVLHVDTCDHCTERLATMASTVFALGFELTRLAEHQAKQKTPFPRALFAVASLLTVGFAFLSWNVQGRAFVEVPHEILTVWRGLRLLGPFAAQHLGFELVVLGALTTLAAAIGGVILAKRHPVLFAMLVLLAPAVARGEVVRRGNWPAEQNISLSLTAVPRSEAVQRLATVAGWSLITEGLDGAAVSVDVRDQPAEKVLTLLLSGGDFVVERDGSLVSVRAQAGPRVGPAAKRVQTPGGNPGEDLFVTEEGHVGKDQVVRDLFIVGSAVVEGTVTGSLVVFGGHAQLVRGAHVSKDVIAFGGSLEIEDGVEIGGDVAALFGALRRGDGPSQECVTCVSKQQDPWQEFFADLFAHLTSAVIVWLLGAITIAMAGSRLNLLREEIERRPLRSLGVGIAMFVAALVLIATLVFTLLGIPLAVLSAVTGVAATYLAFAALPLAVGRRLVGKRSSNPYAHLAVGCGALFLVLCVPVVGAIVSLSGAFMALGALFSTRVAGLFKRQSGSVNA